MILNGYIPFDELKKAIQNGHCYQLEMRTGDERWYIVTRPFGTQLYNTGSERRFHIDGDTYRLDCLGTFIGYDSQCYIPDRAVSKLKELTAKEYETLDSDYGKMHMRLKQADEKIRIEFRQEIRP